MATQVQFRGGTTSEHSTFTGVAREVTVDTTKKTVVVHDGSTAGGIPLAKESAVTSAAAITGGSINGTTVGASTASTGAFTTLSASSTVSGTGFSTYLASPPAIGGTTASTGRFTTVTATGLTSGRVTYAGASGLLSDSSSFVFDGNNLGLGVAAGGTTRLSVTASSGSLATFQQTGATGYGVTIVPGADTTYDAFTINNAANTLNKIRMFGNGNATFAGNVGIGTSSPSALAANYTTVDIRGSTGGALRFGNTTDSAYMYSDSNETNIATATNQRMIFSINTAEKMRLDTSGNLGLGVTPSSFQSVDKVIQIGAQGSIDYSSGNFLISNNFSNPSGVDKYIASTYATMYYQAQQETTLLGLKQ